MTFKPLGGKCYGSIPHLPNSRIGPGDHKCSEGQERIATVKTRDRYDCVIVQEKLDGSNVGIYRNDGKLFALTRSGYLAITSPFIMHHYFALWVEKNAKRFLAVLKDGERLCGEWMLQAHGTRYNLWHEPFFAFDLMIGTTRMPHDEFVNRILLGNFNMPAVISRGEPISVELVMDLLGEHGFHGAELAEGAVWRVERYRQVDTQGNERKLVVDFLVKYVRPDKKDGIYLPEISGKPPIWNVDPDTII